MENKEKQVEKVIKKQQEKLSKLKEKKVEVVGLTDGEVQAVNIVLHYVENIKEQPKAQVYQATQEKQKLEKDLALFYDIEKELKTFNNTTETYKNVANKIKELETFIERVNEFIDAQQKQVDFVQRTIDKINSHITFEEFKDKVVYTYNREYLMPQLDLAYVLFEAPQTKQENKGK